MSEYRRPCNCNWSAGVGPNLLCPVHGNKHHMAARIAELEARTVTDEMKARAIEVAKRSGISYRAGDDFDAIVGAMLCAALQEGE